MSPTGFEWSATAPTEDGDYWTWKDGYPDCTLSFSDGQWAYCSGYFSSRTLVQDGVKFGPRVPSPVELEALWAVVDKAQKLSWRLGTEHLSVPTAEAEAALDRSLAELDDLNPTTKESESK